MQYNDVTMNTMYVSVVETLAREYVSMVTEFIVWIPVSGR